MFMQKLFAFAAVARTGFAARVSGTEELGLELEAVGNSQVGKGRLVVPNPSEICGGTEIWELITGGGSEPLEQAKNVEWKLVESYKDAYMKELTIEQKRLQEQLKHYEAELEEAIKKESLPYTDTKEHTALLNAALGEPTYKGADAAYAWKCGRLRKAADGSRRPLFIRKAYEQAQEEFKTASEAFFSKKQFRLNNHKLLTDCQGLIVKKDSDRESFCGQLCQLFVNAADSHSKQAVGAAATISNKLKTKIEKLKLKLEKVEESMTTCNTDWAPLALFKEQLESLSSNHNKCHDVLRAAWDDMEDAKDKLDILDDDIEAEQEKLRAAASKLKSKDKAVQDAKAALDDAAAKDKDLSGKMDGLTKNMDDLLSELSAASEANGKIGDLKKYVTATMMFMMELVDQGLREPIRNLGFDEDIESLEIEDPRGLEAGVAVKDALASMEDYCASTAMPAFNDLKPLLDLTSLCGFDKTPKMMEDLTVAVEKRAAKMKEELQHIVNWLNPWKVYKQLSVQQGKEAEEKLVGQGQLMYIEQIKSIFPGKNKFFPYLIEWRKDGKHHKLVAQLGEIVSTLKTTMEATQKSLDETKAALEGAQEAHKAAIAKLKSAETAKSLAAAEQKAIYEALQELEEQAFKLEKELEDWEDKYAKAEKAYEDSKKALEDAYVAGTSFLEWEAALLEE